MPEITTRIGLKKPLGNESVTRAAYNENLDIIDQKVATKAGLESISTQMAELVKVKQNITILSTRWIDDTATSRYWYYDIVDADIDANSVVDVNLALSSLSNANKFGIQARSDSFAGYVRIYATTQPTSTLYADLKIIKAVI